MMPRPLFGALAIWLAAAGTASGQAVEIDHDAIRAARIVTAVRITERIALDGRLDEPVWMQAPAADDFLQKLPRNGAPATEKTVARFAYDEDNLYIGVECAESEPVRLSCRLSMNIWTRSVLMKSKSSLRSLIRILSGSDSAHHTPMYRLSSS